MSKKDVHTYVAVFSPWSVVGIILVILKVTGTVSWSWLLVLSPFWIPLGLAVAIIAVTLILLLISFIFAGIAIALGKLQ